MRSKIQKKIAYCLLFGEKETNWQVPERGHQADRGRGESDLCGGGHRGGPGRLQQDERAGRLAARQLPA